MWNKQISHHHVPYDVQQHQFHRWILIHHFQGLLTVLIQVQQPDDVQALQLRT